MTTSVFDSRGDLRGKTRARRSNGRLASRRRLERPHPDQVVGRRREQELPVHPTAAAVTELAQPADRLHPAEDLFNPFPRALTDRVARMTCRARIERATVLLLRDVGRGLEGAQRLHEAVRVVAFVTADRHA